MPRPYASLSFATAWRKNPRAASSSSREIFRSEQGGVYAMILEVPGNDCVFSGWFDRIENPADFKRIHQRIFDLFCSGRFKYWIADLRFATSGFCDAEYWLVNKLMPAVFRAGMERQAVVLPNAAYSEKAVDALSAVSKTLEIIDDRRVRGFSSSAAARRWLYHESSS